MGARQRVGGAGDALLLDKRLGDFQRRLVRGRVDELGARLRFEALPAAVGRELWDTVGERLVLWRRAQEMAGRLVL